MSDEMVVYFIIAIVLFGAIWNMLTIKDTLHSEIKSLRADLKGYLINIDDNVSGLGDNKSIKQQHEESRKMQKRIEKKKKDNPWTRK